ncbi:MAG: hypothetical protein CM1200mP15_19580 [Dehalococcoidia bacterium]|nr:MAG: hypothetical protein CM1200mP15_19580 [Dehalococcoidia bacterium]
MPSTNGYKTFNFSFIVPENKTDDMEKAIASHGAWMRETHSIYTRADPNYGFLGTLVDYYWSKSPEMNNPLDPEAGATGNILYSLTRFTLDQRVLMHTWKLLPHGNPSKSS